MHMSHAHMHVHVHVHVLLTSSAGRHRPARRLLPRRQLRRRLFVDYLTALRCHARCTPPRAEVRVLI